MTRAQRLALRLSLALFLVAGCIIGIALQRGAIGPQAAAACATCTGTYYGASDALVTEAIQNIWPQTSNYCGVETALGAVNYADLWRGLPMRFTSGRDQYSVGKDDNWQAHAISEWGYAPPANNYAGKSNIAADAGTDPRSVAYMTHWYAGTTGGYYFHDYIYRWQMFHWKEPSWNIQVAEATSSLAHSLMYYKQPVNTMINGGAHSVLVTGVFSLNNPRYYWPAQIQGLVFRDPEYAPWNSRFEVDYNTWAMYGLLMPPNNFAYSLWSVYYGDIHKPGDHLNKWDPEPVIGPYKPLPPVPNRVVNYTEHWYGGFTWIARDTYATSPDWSYSAPLPSSWGSLMHAP
jgi:hypothetical protein